MLRLPCSPFSQRWGRGNSIGWRCYSTNIDQNPRNTRNMALVAHIDSGKTTLTESILHKSSYLVEPGTVDTGSTTTDFLPAERERGITIQSASIPIHWKDWNFNLVDTPGHADFGMEVESASRVVDGAVVLVDSVEGVESQTKGVWRQLDRYGVRTRLVFVNKLDRPGASFRSSCLSLLNHRLHHRPLPLVLPVASFEPSTYTSAEPGIEGLVDLVNWELWKWTHEGQVIQQALPPNPGDLQGLNFFPKNHPLVTHLPLARANLLETLSMTSENLMEKLLKGDPEDGYIAMSAKEILPFLRQATLDNQILPVLCGAAAKHIGTELVLNYVGSLFASPIDVAHPPQDKNPPIHALAWKVTWDPKRGWITFVRVYSGKLTRHSILFNATRNQKEKASKLLLFYASEPVEVDEIPFGSIGAILGLKYTRTGDTLISQGGPALITKLPTITPPPAVISVAVIPQSHSDLQPIQDSLASLIRTDPSVRVDIQEGQILLYGLGALHLEIIEGRLRDEWNARFEFGPQRVSFREGLGTGDIDEGDNTWRTEASGKSVDINVRLFVRPLEEHEKGDPAWDNNLVVDKAGRPFSPPDSLPTTPEGYLAQGIANALASSPHTSLAMSRAYVQIRGHTSSASVALSILAGAAAIVLRRMIKSLGRGPILEPYVFVRVNVGEDAIGKVVKDLTERGGEIIDLGSNDTTDADEAGGYSVDGLYIPPKWVSPSGYDAISGIVRMKRSVNAIVPLSRMLDYSSRLRALSGGHGLLELANAGFKEVSDTRSLEIMKEIGRA